MLYYDIKALIFLYKKFKNKKFDAIHSFTSKVGFIVMLAGYFAKINIRLHTFTGQVWFTKKGLPYIFYKNCDRFISKLSTNCYADSVTQMEFLIKSNVIANKKISVLGKGSISWVDLKKFKKNNQIRKILRNELSIPNDTIVFILICRITKEKGVLDLAMAFQN